MCVVESFFLVHPNGVREPQERLRHCERGRSGAPCEIVPVVRLQDQLAFGPGPEIIHPPRSPIIETRSPRRNPQREDRPKSSKFFDGIRLGFTISNPFTIRRRQTSKSKRSKLELVRERPRHPERVQPHQPLPPLQTPHPPHQPPPLPTPYPPYQPHQPLPPHQQPLPQRPPQGAYRPAEIQEPQVRPRIIEVTPQEPTMRGRHHIPREEEIPIRRRPSRRRSFSAVPTRFEDADDSSEEITPNRPHRRRQQRHPSRSSYEEHKLFIKERERRQAAERAERTAKRQMENIRNQRDQEIRRNSNLERETLLERERIRLLERALRDQEERERLERARRAGIRREPRHPIVIHDDRRGSLEERGNRVLRDDIRAEDERRAEREMPREWPRRRDDGGGSRRRDRVAVGEWITHDGDRRRFGRRWF